MRDRFVPLVAHTVRAKIRWILEVWRPIRGYFWLLMLLTLLSTTVAIGYPLVLGMLMDELLHLAQSPSNHASETALGGLMESLRGVMPGDTDTQRKLWVVVAVLLALGVIRFLAAFYPGVRAYLNIRIERIVRERYFAFVLKKGYRFFLRFRTGDLVTRLADDISDYSRIAWFCCSGIFRAVESGTRFAFCLVLMLWLEWRLALLAIAPLPFMLGAFVLLHHRFGLRIEAQRKAISDTNDLLESSFSGIRIIKAFNAEHRQAQALHAQLGQRIVAEMGVARMGIAIDTLNNSLNVVGQLIVIFIGGWFVIHGDMTAGTLYTFFMYLGMLAQPLIDLPNMFVTGKQAFVCIDREEEIRLADQAGEGGAFRGTRGLERFESLTLRDVHFAYPIVPTADESERDDEGRRLRLQTGTGDVLAHLPLGKPILSGVNFSIQRGNRLAIVGRLGSGKSTLLGLCGGTLIPTQGTLELNGVPMAEYDRHRVGQALAVVQQDPVLFSETVRENIVFGRPLDELRLHAVIDAVGMTAEIAAMPKGLSQEVGQRGLTLSGGQRQRLAIARALYGRPQLLLLDDLTSALDAENEDRLWARLDTLIPEATLVVVTHRIATARRMDRIGVLENGTVVAQGTHDDLLASSPLYRQFQHEWIEAESRRATRIPS